MEPNLVTCYFNWPANILLHNIAALQILAIVSSSHDPCDPFFVFLRPGFKLLSLFYQFILSILL